MTIPTATVAPDAGLSREGFNYGGARLRAHLSWSKGALRAGALPDGGSMAVIEGDGTIRTKVGWWREHGKLVITGRRLDRPAPPMRASVPSGYGDSGFQPTGLVFPTVGCWRVTGTAAGARLTFVVRVTKLEQSIVYFGPFRVTVPNRWRWRYPTGFPGEALQISSAEFRPPYLGDTIKNMKSGTFVLNLVPLDNNGPPTAAVIKRSDFMAKSDPQRPREREIANHVHCTPTGACVAIALVYRGNRMPAKALAAINATLTSLRTTRTR